MWLNSTSNLKPQTSNVKTLLVLSLAVCSLRFEVLTVYAASDISLSTPTISNSSSTLALTVVHPTEGMKLPSLSQIFVYGAVTPGSTVTLNGIPIDVHPQGGYLAMVPVVAGDFVIHAEAHGPAGAVAALDRHITVAPGFVISPSTPTTIEKPSISPSDDVLLTPGDEVHVAFQGSPLGSAEFSIDGVARHVPMVEIGSSTMTRRGLYEGGYFIQPGDKANQAPITVSLKGEHVTKVEKAAGRLSIDSSGFPHAGLVTDEEVAVRTGPDEGYDLFLYRGMKIRLTGRVGHEWRVGLSSVQGGWVKDSAVQELPRGTAVGRSILTNFTMVHEGENTLLRIPLDNILPYRTEQSLDPMRLVVTLYGAVDKTNLIKYDPLDPLIRLVQWKQISPDTCQIVIEPTFKTWWGYDVRYEGTTLVVEIRKPWTAPSLKGMVIAVDPGHGGSDNGAIGPHGWTEKDANLAIAWVVKSALEEAGAKPFLTREKDMDVPLYDRAKIAWTHNARIFVSVHCNASGEGENPIWNNGFSIYAYQPQSLQLARDIHASYLQRMTIPDHGLYFADLAVCRTTQMPAVLTEQAFIIVPAQEILIFSPKFRKTCAEAILGGIKQFIAKSGS